MACHVPSATFTKACCGECNYQSWLLLVAILSSFINNTYGVFTLPDTETERDTDNLTQNPIGVCVGFCVSAVWAPLHNSAQPIFYRLRYRQCEHTVSNIYWLHMLLTPRQQHPTLNFLNRQLKGNRNVSFHHFVPGDITYPCCLHSFLTQIQNYFFPLYRCDIKI